MKRMRFSCLLLAAAMLLGGCASTNLAVPEDTEPAGTTAEPAAPAFTAEVTLSGEGRADSAVKANVKTDARGKFSYRWILDGRELSTRNDTLQIPCSAAEKDLVCRVSCEGYEGFAESEPLTVLDRGENASLTCAGLYEDVKWIGRTMQVGTGMTADWSCAGFEMNLWAAGGEFRVYYEAGYKCYFAFFVDGVQVDRPLLNGDDSFAVEIPSGNHTIKLCKETEISSAGAGITLKAVVFDGDVLERPADKDLYIEVAGDSIACGDGSLGTYKEGEKWVLADHSGTHGFGYLTAEILDADVSVVSKGGIGVVKPAGQYNIGQLYEYVNHYRSADKYDFDGARVPDVILVEQGANDGSVATDDEYFEALGEFVKMLRDKWGDAPAIVWVGKRQSHYETALRLKAARKSDENFFVFRFAYGGSGSAALTTQKAGHPSAAEQREMAEALAAFLRENGIAK